MANFTGKQIRNTYDRIVQFNSGSLTDALGGALSASIHQLTVDTNLVVSGSIRAEEIIVTKTSSSVIFQSGSNQFGDSLDDKQYMTGSVDVTGSLTVNGSTFAGVSSSLATLSGSFEVIEGKTLVSSSNQIASNISGSFTIASGGLATRIASQESFSSSLDATYATDAQLATAVSQLNLDSGSYAVTGSNLFDAQQNISSSLVVSQSITLGDKIKIGQYHWNETFPKIHDKSNRSEIWFEQNRNSSDGGDMVFFRSRGVPGAEVIPQIGDNIFTIAGRAMVSGSATIRSGSGLAIADFPGVSAIRSTLRQIGSGSAGGDLEFLTAPSGFFNTKTRLTITEEGAIRASGSFHSETTIHGRTGISTDAAATASLGFVSASVVQAETYRNVGSGESVINSANNLTLSSSNAVVVSGAPLRLNNFSNAQTGSFTFANGDMIYNTDRNKFLGYANGAFVELH